MSDHKTLVAKGSQLANPVPFESEWPPSTNVGRSRRRPAGNPRGNDERVTPSFPQSSYISSIQPLVDQVCQKQEEEATRLSLAP